MIDLIEILFLILQAVITSGFVLYISSISETRTRTHRTVKEPPGSPLTYAEIIRLQALIQNDIEFSLINIKLKTMARKLK